MNKLHLVGRICSEPQLKCDTEKGDKVDVLYFRVAVDNRVYNHESQEWTNMPNFIPITMFGKRAKGLVSTLTNGQLVAVVARVGNNKWEDDHGDIHYGFDFIASEIELYNRPKPKVDIELETDDIIF